MTSPDLELRYRQLELPIIAGGNFSGRDILDTSLLDDRSIQRLNSVSEAMAKLLTDGVYPQLAKGKLMVSISEMGRTGRLALESAFIRLGGNIPLHLEPPKLDDPYFDYRILDIAACLPAVIIMDSPEKEMMFKTSGILRMLRKNIPIINARLVEETIREGDARLVSPGMMKTSPTGMALLALVLGKIK